MIQFALVQPAQPTPRKSIGQMLYEMSRPGLELPAPPRSPARIDGLGLEVIDPWER